MAERGRARGESSGDDDGVEKTEDEGPVYESHGVSHATRRRRPQEQRDKDAEWERQVVVASGRGGLYRWQSGGVETFAEQWRKVEEGLKCRPLGWEHCH